MASLSSPSAVSSTASVPRVFSVLDGNVIGQAVTTRATPTVLVSRIEQVIDNGTSDGSDGPGFYSVLTTLGTQQGVAISSLAFANAAAAADVVGIYGVASQNGTAGTRTAYGGFFHGLATTAGSGAIGIQMLSENNTGTDKTYNPATIFTSPFIVGMDIEYTASGAHLGEAGILLRAGNGKMDVGLAILNGVNKADIQTDTASTTILLAGATAHINGIDLSAATFGSSAFKSPNFSVSGSGTVSAAGYIASGLTGATCGAGLGGTSRVTNGLVTTC